MDERSSKCIIGSPVPSGLMHILEVRDIPLDVTDVPIDDPMEVFKICLRIQQTCRAANGFGLSAVQIGVPWKLFIVGINAMFAEHKQHRSKDGAYRYFVNCDYVPVGDGKVSTIEGCLSLPNRRFRVSRWSEVSVNGLELRRFSNKMRFVPFSCKFISDPSGHAGTVFQHEIDHQKGVTIDQHGQELDIHSHRFL